MNTLVEPIETVYKNRLSDDLGLSRKDKTEEFQITKGIVDAVRYFHRRFLSLIYRQRTLMATLIWQRSDIMEMLQAAHADFINQRSQAETTRDRLAYEGSYREDSHEA